LWYARDKDKLEFQQPLSKTKLIDYIEEHKREGVGFYYTRVVKDFGNRKLIGTIKDGGGDEIKIYKHTEFEFSSINNLSEDENVPLEEAYDKYSDSIFMVTNAQTSILSKVNQYVKEKQNLISYDYIPKSGKDKGSLITKYVWNKTLMVWLRDTVKKDDGKLYKTEQVGTLWDDISWGRIDLEGDVTFKNGKKPVALIKRICEIIEDTECKILDFFAGSGTTAQAVLELNEEDGGNRKFIMIQMSENSKKEPKKNICKDITRERIVKVIENELKDKEVGFEYRKVGQPIDAETILSGQLPTYEQLAKYVFYLATGQTPKKEDISKDKYLAGKIGDTRVYLLYKESLEELQRMALTHDFAKDLPKGKKIVYAPACFLDDDYLSENDIRFVSIPYNLFERAE